MPILTQQRPGFIKTAEAFCAHIEGAENCDRITFVRMSFRLICRLLSEVIELPEVDGALDTHPISSERYNTIVKLLKDQIGEHDYYKMVFDPYESEAAALFGSVSDDLSDIWRDLKSGLEALEQGSLDDAIEQWRFSFAYHWGSHHATNVLSPLMKIMLRNGWYEPPAEGNSQE